MEFVSKYTEILKQNNFPEAVVISDIEITKSADLQGEHYCSVVEFVRLSLMKSGSVTDELNLFVKKRVESDDKTLQSFYKEMFVKESNFLGRILNSLFEFCQERNAATIGLENYFPKCYLVSDSELVMENLVKKGFKMINKLERQDFAQASSVMEGLAKLHGVSYSMIQSTPGKSKTIMENMPMLSEIYFKQETTELMQAMFLKTFNVIMQILEEIATDLSKEALQFFDDNSSETNLYETMIQPLKGPHLYDVIVHGDCWINNIMIKSSEPKTEVKFVDFQCSKLSSPASDIGYYIFTSLNQEARAKWVQLTRIYFNTFLQTLSLLGQTFPFTFEDLLKEIAWKSIFGLLIGVFQIVGIAAMSSMDAEKSKGFKDAEFNENIHNLVKNNPERVKELVMVVTNLISDFKSMQAFTVNSSNLV